MRPSVRLFTASAALLVLTACPHANPSFKNRDAGGEDSGGNVVPDASSGEDTGMGGPDAAGADSSGGGDDAGGDDAHTGNLVRERSCATTVSFRPQAGRDIFIAGSWDGFNPTATRMTDPELDGIYTATLNLAPGLYAYKFVVDGNWILDPGHKYRAYDNGVENSGLRVPDCHQPLVELDHLSGALNGMNRGDVQIVLTYSEANGGPGPDVNAFDLSLREASGARAVMPSEMSWDTNTWQLTVHLTGLTDGKHTLTAMLPNTAGAGSNTIYVPFWVEADAFDWRDAIIYMAVTDRFRDADPSKNPAPTMNAVPTADYYGGDLQGVKASIDEGYFDQLGVHALWLTPFNVNPVGAYPDGDGVHNVTGYHGYWPIDPRAVDERIGGDAALKDLVASAHQHGIRILMDLVINHVHELHPYVAQHPDWFSTLPNGCICGTPGCDWTERRLDCLFKPYLPDVNWQNGQASEQFISDALWWLENFDLDGIRVDAVKHVPDGAIFNLATRVEEELERAGTRYFLLGETAMGWYDCDPSDPNCNADNYGTISRYVGEHALDGQFDFVLHHSTSTRVWAYDQSGLIHADVWTRASAYRYPSDAIMTPYVGSHDESRFITHASDPQDVNNKWPEQTLAAAPMSTTAYRRLGLAETWNLTIPGAPLLYYGDEYGEFGSADPDNRHQMRFGADRDPDEQEIFAWVSAVGAARWELPALRRGDLTTIAVSETFWAYVRATPASWAVVAFNKDGNATTQTLTLDARFGVVAGTMLRDRISGAVVTASGPNMIDVQLGAYSAAILAP